MIKRYFEVTADDQSENKAALSVVKTRKTDKEKRADGERVRKKKKARPEAVGRRSTEPKVTQELVNADAGPEWKQVPRFDKVLHAAELERYSRGAGPDLKVVKSKVHTKKLRKRERDIEFSAKQTVRAELLLPEESGFLEADEGEVTTQFTQTEIAASVDITSAAKRFDLNLRDFGPYRMNYTRNGRFLLLGGKRGHVAATDWVTKKLLCEINVMEEIFDVQWLHQETMFAVAQKKWVYMYDNQGTELHCLKKMDQVLRMEFLPYHFLLATASELGYLTWLDISIGKIVSQFNSRMGRLNIMAQNPYNALICLGHAKGTVTMWSPNVKEPLAKLLCHPRPIQAIAIDSEGRYMATAAMDRGLRIWDIRKFDSAFVDYKLRSSPSCMSFSQRRMLSLGMGNIVEVYRDCCAKTTERAYLRHQLPNSVGNMQFCPYEDVLGVATAVGFSSLLVPGSAEPNFDALESNPFQSKSQRKEAEVKALLEKIQYDMITLDPAAITEIDVPTLQDKVEAKRKLLHVKPPKIDFQPRKKGKWKKGTAKVAQTKRILKDRSKREFVKKMKSMHVLEDAGESERAAGHKKNASVLDRFRPRTVTKK
ncbi:WD repeat-containing protein 46 [Bacillus rossius redtenbacheri]|uniref:WD repeat-containing protein 46 n=1 Tax=Bacillus rossius redtenbacheri TaxID=93214 RepID=UPI002FDD7ED6